MLSCSFQFTDLNGNKLKDENVINYIEQVRFQRNLRFNAIWYPLVLILLLLMGLIALYDRHLQSLGIIHYTKSSGYEGHTVLELRKAHKAIAI